MTERIVLIGAGSAMFTRGLIADLIRTGDAVDLALVDVDAEALDIVTRLARKMVEARHAEIRVTGTVDLRTALSGATVVVCTIGVGGRRAWELDVFVPRKYGINAPVGDTVGPGGTSRALRMIPAMVKIAQDVLEFAPNALFFNYGNPMAPVCRAVHKATGANMVGLCHGVHSVAQYLGGVMAHPESELVYTAVGINHLTWFTELRRGGLDLLPGLREEAARRLVRAPRISARATSFAASEADRAAVEPPDDNPFSWRLFDLFGAFPAVLDRHVTEFFPQFFRDGSYYGRVLGIDAYSFEDTVAAGDRIYDQMREDALAPGALDTAYFEQLSGEHEQVLDIVQAIRHDQRSLFSANLPNTGQAPNLPREAIVEGPAVADGAGLRAVTQPPLAPALAGALATRYQWAETVVEAALEGSREKFIQALVLDGSVQSLESAAALADDLLAAQAPYLPWAQAKRAKETES